jgi:anti-sigma-K factor RskA
MSDIHALSGAYAVHALDDFERAHFERHLAACAECEAEVISLRDAAATLPDLVADEVEPPARLRDGVLAQISTVRPLPPATPTRHRAAPRRRWIPALVAAAVALFLGVGVSVWQPWADDPPPSAVELVTSARDARSTTLSFPDGAKATVVHSASVGRAVITTSKMPPPPSGRVYELWLLHPDGSLSPAGLMPMREDQTVVFDGDASVATGAGITVEPEGGSDQPTTEPIALFDFADGEPLA